MVTKEKLSDIRQKADEVDAQIIEYVEAKEDTLNELIISIIKYAMQIISPLRERAYIMHIISNYYNIEKKIIKPFLLSAELIILAAYIKDDIIDYNEVRKRKQTVHNKFGTGNALLTSDILLNMGYEMILNSSIKEIDKVNICNIVNTSYTNLCKGQLSQFENLNDITPKKVENIAYLRAGDIIGTFFSIPAIIAEDDNLNKTFYDYGKWLGISLQFKNDFEDFLTDVSNGDSVILQDMLYKQPNIILAYLSKYYPTFSAKEKLLFDKYWGKRNQINVSKIDQKLIIELLISYNVFEKAYKHLYDVCKFSIESIKYLEKCDEKIKLLEFVKLIYQFN